MILMPDQVWEALNLLPSELGRAQCPGGGRGGGRGHVLGQLSIVCLSGRDAERRSRTLHEGEALPPESLLEKQGPVQGGAVSSPADDLPVTPGTSFPSLVEAVFPLSFNCGLSIFLFWSVKYIFANFGEQGRAGLHD